MNLVEPTKQSPSFDSRLLKYAFRGFRVAVPGFSPELVRTVPCISCQCPPVDENKCAV